MKRAIVLFIVLLLVCAIALAITQFLINPQTAQSIAVKSRTELTAKKANVLSYKGVSFTFDPSIASSVEPRTILAQNGEQVCDIWPEHPRFEFTGYNRRKELCCNEPNITVFPIDKFSAAAAPYKEVSGSRSYNAVDEEVRVLKLLLATKPLTASIGRFLGKVRGEYGCGPMPFLPLVEACMTFTAHHRYLNFKNGKGVFFLAQWDRETTQINNGWLEYCFQGITDDGKYYVSAGFPVAAPFLPNGDEPDVMEWNEKNYLLSHKSGKYLDYLRPVKQKLEALPDEKYQPVLNSLEQLIRSLEIKTIAN